MSRPRAYEVLNSLEHEPINFATFHENGPGNMSVLRELYSDKSSCFGYTGIRLRK
jgi:hypothetical protein